ncbi:GSCFA domain-containing protein [Agrobacterium sp. rho-13.3]|uniref:GSCFA domain-containing protein n=1 Tax=Agrobacterium sp. rho-13.3 TaxID=3072980 RepID=UPI002A118D14|nr:GSCFA domain-containing protein [Agrobacterium sp. rho-13.3]MDX8310014.1 GSCFA domain-containing protein [Agrobacterium sp. rho-13.3]
MNILFTGNCQVETLARAADTMARNAVVKAKEVHSFEFDYRAEFSGYDVVFAQLPVFERASLAEGLSAQLVKLPRLSFNGFHPDDCYVNYNGKRAHSPCGALHSKIIFGAWFHGIARDDVESLFCNSTFEALKFSQFFDKAVKALYSEGDQCDIDLRPLFADWMKGRSPFMLTMNHPKAEPLIDLAQIVIAKAGIDFIRSDFDLMHNLARYVISPVFPEIAARHGMRGSSVYKRDERLRGGSGLFPLKQFIEHSYDIYETWDKALLNDHAVMKGAFRDFFENRKKTGNGGHPYRNIPPHQNWRKSFAGVEASEVDPVVDSGFELTKEDKVATAGSCFAQHIAKALSASGLNYFVTETGPEDQGYGVYSARYGNIYTTAQLSQLIDRSYGRFTPVDNVWQTREGQFADPFRPEMPLVDRSSARAIEEQQSQLFASVRSMIEEMDYFVFTLGLTEAWRSKIDGAVFPIAPGVTAGEMDESKYEFVNFTVDEVYADLMSSIQKIRAINPRVRFILTVSPVPLMATFEPRHVLQSTTYSKSVLRVVADKASKIDGVFYFPSYEVITGHFNRGAYYDDDLRSVRKEGVEHVMRLFLKHCTDVEGSIIDQHDEQAMAIRANNEVLCAESLLDA